MKSEIEFEDLPEAEKMRLTVEFEARLAASNERTRQENGKLEEKLARLKSLVERRRAYADRLEVVLEEMRVEKLEMAHEEESVLAL